MVHLVPGRSVATVQARGWRVGTCREVSHHVENTPPRCGSCRRSTTRSSATTTAPGSSTTPTAGLSVAGARVVLVDGRVAATWNAQAGTVIVTPLRPLSRADHAALRTLVRGVF